MLQPIHRESSNPIRTVALLLLTAWLIAGCTDPDNEGYSGLGLAVESAYRVGSVIVVEILGNWATYEGQIPAVLPTASSAGRASGDAPADVAIELLQEHHLRRDRADVAIRMILGASPEARPARLNEPTIRGMSLCLIFLSACATSSNEPNLGVAIQTGRMENAEIREASGLALSRRQDGRLWTMNDGESGPVLYALSIDGTEHGTVRLTNARNVDWEDMASFELDGTPWLLVADVGDNLAKREQVTLYIVAEPDLSTQDAVSSQQISFRYPDGPRDVEAVAVDANEQRVYLLSKRTIPAQLYAVPLATAGSTRNEVVTATYLGPVASIPQPTQDDLDRALAEQNWYWQPTAMDFSADGSMAVILTYPAAYLYDRQPGESWLDALQRPPVRFELGGIERAEAVVLRKNDILVTVEMIHAPLYRLQYRNER